MHHSNQLIRLYIQDSIVHGGSTIVMTDLWLHPCKQKGCTWMDWRTAVTHPITTATLLTKHAKGNYCVFHALKAYHFTTEKDICAKSIKQTVWRSGRLFIEFVCSFDVKGYLRVRDQDNYKVYQLRLAVGYLSQRSLVYVVYGFSSPTHTCFHWIATCLRRHYACYGKLASQPALYSSTAQFTNDGVSAGWTTPAPT